MQLVVGAWGTSVRHAVLESPGPASFVVVYMSVSLLSVLDALPGKSVRVFRVSAIRFLGAVVLRTFTFHAHALLT